MSKSSVNRRNFMKYSSLGAAAALAGCSGNGDKTSNPSTSGDGGAGGGSGGDSGSGSGSGGMSSGKRPLNWIGLGLYASQEQKKRYKDVNDIDIKIKATDSATIKQSILGGNTTYDAVSLDATVTKAFESQDALQPIPTSKLDNWGSDKITKAFLNPEQRLSYLGNQAKSLADIMYQDSKKRENLMLPPESYGFDGIAYNPKFIDDVTTWGAVFDDQYKGKSTFMGIPLNAIPEPIMYLADKGVIDANRGDMNNPTKDQVDQAIDFLIKQKKAGQFRAIWTNGGQATNLMTSEEVIIGDLWHALLPGVRDSGTPAGYSTMKKKGFQGWRFFIGAIMATTAAKKRDNLDEVYELEDQALGAWYPNLAANIMFATAQYPNKELVRNGSDKYGEGMGPEFYDWAYEGKATYEAVDKPYLFTPASYDWSMEEGSPDSNGQKFNGGTIEERFDSIGIFQIDPEQDQYITKRFREFMNA